MTFKLSAQLWWGTAWAKSYCIFNMVTVFSAREPKPRIYLLFPKILIQNHPKLLRLKHNPPKNITYIVHVTHVNKWKSHVTIHHASRIVYTSREGRNNRRSLQFARITAMFCLTTTTWPLTNACGEVRGEKRGGWKGHHRGNYTPAGVIVYNSFRCSVHDNNYWKGGKK